MNKRLEILNTALLVAVLAVGVTILVLMNGGQKIGARTANPTYLDTDEWTQLTGDLAVDDLEVGDDAWILGDLVLGNTISVTGVNEAWYEGTCADATTTFLSVANQESAAVWIDKFIISGTNGTTSITFDIGTSTSATAAPSENIADDASVATSTAFVLYNTTGVVAATFDQVDPGANSQDLIYWPSDQYIVGLATEVGGTGGVAGGANTFACTYKIHYFW